MDKPKPSKQYFRDFLRGKPPSRPDQSCWEYASGPLAIFPQGYAKRQQTSLRAAASWRVFLTGPMGDDLCERKAHSSGGVNACATTLMLGLFINRLKTRGLNFISSLTMRHSIHRCSPPEGTLVLLFLPKVHTGQKKYSEVHGLSR